MESERRIKRKRKKKIRILAFITVIAICLLGYIAVNNQFIKGIYYKAGNPISDKNPILELEEGILSDYRVFDNIILSTSKNGIYAYNLSMDTVSTKHFEELSSLIASFNDLKIKEGKENIAAYDKSGRNVIVFDNKKIISNIKVNSSIIYAKPTENGGALVLAEDTSAKNQLILYNRDGKEEFIWHSGVNNLLDAAYIEDEGLLAVISADLSTGILNSKISFFDITSANPKSEMTLDDVFVTNIEFFGKILTAISDKGIYYITEDGNVKNIYSYNEKMLSAFEISKNGEIALSFNSNSNETLTEIINKKGKKTGSFTSDGEILYMDSFNGNFLLCEKRSVSVISNRGFLLREIAYNKDLRKAFFIGRNKILLVGNSEIRTIN